MNNAERSDLNYTEYKGIYHWHINGREDRKKNIGVVIARGLGVPTKIEDERLSWMFSEIGYTTAFCNYTGTWFENRERGKFLKKTKEGLSPETDVSKTIDFVVEKLGAKEVYLLGNCFGATPVLVAGAKKDAVKKILTVGGMIYTDNDMANDDYLRMDRNIKSKQGETDFFLQIGREHKKQYGKNAYKGFSLRKWKNMVMGKTSHNAYDHLDSLSHKHYLGIHALDDTLVSHKRTLIFATTLKTRADATGTSQHWIINPADYGIPKIGHRGIEQTPEFHKRLLQFYNPNEDEENIQEMLEKMQEIYPEVRDFFKRQEHITRIKVKPIYKELSPV
jgi:hypothetical protein